MWLFCLLWLLRPIAGAGQQTPSNAKAHATVNQAIAAMGGDHYLQINQRSGNGHLYSFNTSGQLASPGTRFWVYYQFPSDERLELTSKRDVIFIYTGNEGWEITYKGVAPALRKQVDAYVDATQHSLDTILKTWAQDPRTLMLDQGMNNLDVNQVETVQMTNAGGETVTVDFSVITHLPMRVSWRHLDTETGGHYTESVIYGNWTAIGGIEVPFSQDHFDGPQRVDQRFFDAVSFAPFPASVFTPMTLEQMRKAKR